jgi:hypothetical protein
MAFNIIARQVGNDVIFSGSGSIKTGSLTTDEFGNYGGEGAINTSFFGLVMGGTNLDVYWSYFPINVTSWPTNFGTGPYTSTSVTDGDTFGFQRSTPRILFLPASYSNEQPLNSSMTFSNQTISSLGLSAGTYTISWGTGSSVDSVVLVIEPEPSPTPTVTPTNTPTPSITPTNTQTPTVTPTITSTNTPTPSITPTITPTKTVTPTVTSTITPTPSVTATVTPSVTPTLTPSPTPFGVLDVNVQYDYTNEIFGSFSGGSWNAQYGNVPHPINYQPERRLTVIDLSSITLGGVNGLNN